MLNGFLGGALFFAAGFGVRVFLTPAAPGGDDDLAAGVLGGSIEVASRCSSSPSLSGGFVIGEFLVAQDHEKSGTRSNSVRLVAFADRCLRGHE
jgi:hypothetical protein